MNANKIAYAASALIALVALYKFFEHPSNRNLRAAVIDAIPLL